METDQPFPPYNIVCRTQTFRRAWQNMEILFKQKYMLIIENIVAKGDIAYYVKHFIPIVKLYRFSNVSNVILICQKMQVLSELKLISSIKCD